MPPPVLILPTALDNYRLAVRETARKWSSRAGKGVWPPASGGIDSIPEAYARVKIKKNANVSGARCSSFTRSRTNTLSISSLTMQTFVIATVFQERMEIPAQLRAIAGLTQYEALTGHPRPKL